jgi:hypothetical protein
MAIFPNALGEAIPTLRAEIVRSLLRPDFAKVWTQAYSLTSRAPRRLRTSDLFCADDRRAPPRRRRVMDTELAICTARRQCANDQHLPLDMDQLLFHVPRLWPREPRRGRSGGIAVSSHLAYIFGRGIQRRRQVFQPACASSVTMLVSGRAPSSVGSHTA